MNEMDVRKLVQAAIIKAGGVRSLARMIGVTPSYVCDVRLGRRAPGPPFLAHLGLERVVTVIYRKKPLERRA